MVVRRGNEGSGKEGTVVILVVSEGHQDTPEKG